MRSFLRCDGCRGKPTFCARCWFAEIRHRLETLRNDGALLDLLASDAAELSEVSCAGTIHFKVGMKVDHGRYTTGETFDIELADGPMWRVSIPWSGLESHERIKSIESASLRDVIRATLDFVVTRDDALAGSVEALMFRDGTRETALPIVMGMVSKRGMDDMKYRGKMHSKWEVIT